MKKMYILLTGLVAIFLLIAFSCGFVAKENIAPEITETSAWYTENIDPSFWTRSGKSSNETAYITLKVFADDPDGIEDITYVSVTCPSKLYWTLRDKDRGIDKYNSKDKYFGGTKYYSLKHPNVIYLGKYTVLVRDSDGNEITDKFSVNRPGKKSGSGFIYSEDYKGPTSDGTEMLKRATIIDAEKNSNRIKIQFRVDDSRVFNGYIWLYDISGKYITWSGFFKNKINDAKGINNDGTVNVLRIKSSDLELEDFSFEDIKGIHVVLTDGTQYAPIENEYDHRSVSKYRKIK